MAPGGVHAGYKNSLYMYAAEKKSDLEGSFEEWLVELTTGLELALEGNTGDNISESEEDNLVDEEQKEACSARKKDWEEVLEQAEVVEAMLRQALGNGLGQQKEEEKTPQKKKEEECDNDFSLEGVSVPADGKSKGNNVKSNDPSAGSSKSFQTNSGNNAEYLYLANSGRKKADMAPLRIICLTCETPCDSKN